MMSVPIEIKSRAYTKTAKKFGEVLLLVAPLRPGLNFTRE